MSKVLFLPFEGAKLILASSFYIPTVSFFSCYRLQFGHMREELGLIWGMFT